MRHVFLAGLIVLALTLGTSPLSADENDDGERNALTFLRRIFDDSMIAKGYRQARIFSKGRGRFGYLDYAVVKRSSSQENSTNVCSVKPYGNGQFTLLMSLENNDSVDVSQEPQWEKLEPQWDAFVARHWSLPGLHRLGKWKQALASYKPGLGTFNISYGIQEQNVTIFSVSLDIRLADGMVGGVSTFDIRPLLLGKQVTPAPSNAEMLAKIKPLLPGKTQLKNLRIDSSYREVLMSDRINHQGPNRFLGFIDNLDLRGETPDGKIVGFGAMYAEPSKQVSVSELFDPAKTKSLVRPLTTAQDAAPIWNEDGKKLLFVTTRDSKGRPWWQRDSTVFSLASAQSGESTMTSLTVVRPVKPQNADFSGYLQPSLSSSGRYLVMALNDLQSKICVLDTKEAILYLPDPITRMTMSVRSVLSPKEYSLEVDWRTGGYDWLPDEHGFIVSLLYKDRDPNLYVARWKPNAPPQQMELVPIIVELGDDVLPHLGNGGKRLAWARKVYEREADKKPDEKDQWQLMVADFDTAKLTTEAPAPPPNGQIEPLTEIAKQNTRNRRTLDLPDEPMSISWDNKAKRWLVVTKSGMLWVSETDGKLQAMKAPSLSWGKIALSPTSAAVSPQGDRIAVAATLSTPQTYPKTEAVVSATIFLWDGKSQQVKPLFDPSLNGIPRYKFPKTGSTWARVSGDAKAYGLEGLADPSLLIGKTKVESTK